MSPYRLAAHLTSAAVIYGTLLWTCLSLAYPLSTAAAAPASSAAAAGAAVLRRWAHPVAGLIAITALSGDLQWFLHKKARTTLPIIYIPITGLAYSLLPQL